MKNKKSQSLMISYVILIAIVIGLSIGVFIWLKDIAKVDPIVNCKDGTSIILTNITCSPFGIDLDLKNNGRFNIEGIILTISNETRLTNPTYLVPEDRDMSGNVAGSFFFTDELKPGETLLIDYSNMTKIIEGTLGFSDEVAIEFTEVRYIQIQPFIYDEKGVVICQDALIKQETSTCSLA